MNKYIFFFFGNIALLDPIVHDTVIILVNRFNHPNISNSYKAGYHKIVN